jgi:hypothetical protein
MQLHIDLRECFDIPEVMHSAIEALLSRKNRKSLPSLTRVKVTCSTYPSAHHWHLSNNLLIIKIQK